MCGGEILDHIRQRIDFRQRVINLEACAFGKSEIKCAAADLIHHRAVIAQLSVRIQGNFDFAAGFFFYRIGEMFRRLVFVGRCPGIHAKRQFVFGSHRMSGKGSDCSGKQGFADSHGSISISWG